jgi:4-amino-4-deoxy-L-arabinose transferase-like glycosyltransferase
MTPHTTHQKKSHNLLLLVILLGGFALRLYKLGQQSLWYDETVSAFLAGHPTLELIGHTARDIHPPGYYLLLHFWTRLVGDSEFALAYFSLIFGILLIPLTYQLARLLTRSNIALWAALLLAFSPYNVWYSQEVRMYTLGAALGIAATYCALKALLQSQTTHQFKSSVTLYWLGYVIIAALGLYTLYYFAFLLVVINLFFLIYTLWPAIKRKTLFALLIANGLVFVLYLPWLPIAWRQATNPPVPPWRSTTGLWPMVIESWSALSLGQSVEPATIWFVLIVTLILFASGFYYLVKISARLALGGLTPWLFMAYTFGPLLIITAFAIVTPLYHVRYVFTYSPAFYILLGAGLAYFAVQTRVWVAVAATAILLIGSAYSLIQYHFNPRYQTDDFRSAVAFIEQNRQPGDIMMTNAGYTYTAFLYYADIANLNRQRLVPYQSPGTPNQPRLLQTGTVDGDPNLGWGDPRSDFYAMSAQETLAALEAMSNDHTRLWMLRAYDTVTDPHGVIRAWLDENSIPLEDEVFRGQSNIRVQGFLLKNRPKLQGETIDFADGISLTGWILAQQTWQPGQTIPLQLGWMATATPSVDYKMSLKLWNERGELAGQGEDTWPVGTLFRATDWPVGQTVYQPTSFTLPKNLTPGRYWLNVELYHPDTVQPLSRLDGDDPVVTLGPVIVQ